MELELYSSTSSSSTVTSTSKLLMSKCRVCGAFPAQFHFGAVACRSCAAFFRRFVHSRKSFVHCTCNDPARSSYACRLCRMKKCLVVGMNRDLVQQQREKHIMSGTVGSGPKITINHLVLRAFEKLRKVKDNYNFANKGREIMQGASAKPGDFNCYQISCLLQVDFHLFSDMIVKTFPELNQLSEVERNVLYKNFYPKWCVFESTMVDVKYNLFDCWFHDSPSGEKVFALKEYYGDKSINPQNLGEEQLLIFNPYWKYMVFTFKNLLANIDFDEMEEMCVLALLLFDTGYSNLSPKCADMCEKFRKCILRELKAYCLEKEKNDLRFFEILDALPLVEKAEEKRYRDVQLCWIHNIKINQEYYEIMSASKS